METGRNIFLNDVTSAGKEYLEVIGESIENLPADINRYWEEN